jgi:hypothetical protein
LFSPVGPDPPDQRNLIFTLRSGISLDENLCWLHLQPSVTFDWKILYRIEKFIEIWILQSAPGGPCLRKLASLEPVPRANGSTKAHFIFVSGRDLRAR